MRFELFSLVAQEIFGSVNMCLGKCDLARRQSLDANSDDTGFCNMVVLYCQSQVR